MIKYNCEQGTEEWYALRRGIPTASGFSRIITPAKCEPSKGMDGYIYELLADKYSGGTPMGIESFTSRSMQDGIDTEPEARRCYSFVTGNEVEQVGFCTTDDGRFGCSPDGLVGELSGLELKCPLPKTHLQYLFEGVLPSDYKAQVHGSMIVTGRPSWDFMSYAIGFPEFLITVEQDEFTGLMRKCLAIFREKYDAAEARLRELGVELPEVPVDEDLADILF